MGRLHDRIAQIVFLKPSIIWRKFMLNTEKIMLNLREISEALQ